MQDRMCIILSTWDGVLDHGISATVVLPAGGTRFVRIKAAGAAPQLPTSLAKT